MVQCSVEKLKFFLCARKRDEEGVDKTTADLFRLTTAADPQKTSAETRFESLLFFFSSRFRHNLYSDFRGHLIAYLNGNLGVSDTLDRLG